MAPRNTCAGLDAEGFKHCRSCSGFTQDRKRASVWIKHDVLSLLFTMLKVKGCKLYVCIIYIVNNVFASVWETIEILWMSLKDVNRGCIVGFTTWQRCCQLVIHCDLDVVDCCSWEGNGILMLMWLLQDSCLASFFWKLLVSIRMVVARISNMWINCYFARTRNTPCIFWMTITPVESLGAKLKMGVTPVEIYP